MFRRVVITFLLVLGIRRVAAQELSADLSARFRYDGNTMGDEADLLFYANVSITDLIKDHLDLKISGWGYWNLNSPGGFDQGIEGGPVRISEAYADLRNLGCLTRLRIGRQYLYDVDYLHFDGATLRFDEGKPFSYFLFGGREANFYQTSKDDWVGGGGVVWKPTWRTQHQFDAYALNEGGDTFFAQAWRWNQYWGNYWRTTSRLRFLEGEIRDWRFHLSKFFQKIGVGLDVDYYLQPFNRGQGSQLNSQSLSAYGLILGESKPYQRLSVELNKLFAEKWMLQLGGTIRRQFDTADNQGYNSYSSNSAHLSLTRFNAFVKNLDLTLAGELIDNQRDRMETITGSATYHPTRTWTFSTGASYSHFLFDPFDFNTKLNGQADDLDLLLNDLKIPSYFFEVQWKPNRTFDVRGMVNWEMTQDLPGSGLTVRLGINYHLRRSLARDDAQAGKPAPQKDQP